MDTDSNHPNPGGKLAEKQERFCSEYLIDLNGTKAAIRAGYAPKTACQVASRMMRKRNILSRIAQKKAERCERTELSQDAVVAEFKAIAFTRIHEFYELIERRKKPAVKLKDFTAMTPSQLAAMKSITNTKMGLAVELHDKLDALDKLGKHLGIYEKDNKQGQPIFHVMDYAKVSTPGFDDHGKSTKG